MKLFTFLKRYAVYRPAAAFRKAGLTPKKVISLVTAGCFILTSVLAPAAASNPEMRREVMPLKSVADGFELPYTAGRMTDAQYFGSEDVVINIQDLHCHPEVQKNIARILGFLDERYSLTSVYLEGAIGSVNTSLLGAAGDKKLRQEIIEALLEKGQLTGAEYYSLNSQKYDLIRGLENGRLYKENALRLKSILENRKEILDALSGLRENLDTLKNTYYGQKNRRIDRIVGAYRTGKYDARRYFGFLIKSAEKSGIDIYGYRNIVNYGRLMTLEKDLNYSRITSELQQFITVLKGTLSYADFNYLVEHTRNFSQIDELYLYLAKLERSGTITAGRSFPNLHRFFAYIETSQKVNPLGLVSEEKKLLREIQTRNAKSVPEREIVFLQDYYLHLEDYANNRVSAEDYDYYVANSCTFKNVLGKYTADDTLASFAPFARTLDDFYRVNMERNESFLQNTLGGNARGPAGAVGENDASKVFSSFRKGGRITVTVTGGFHTAGLAKLLRERKISYVIITPNVTQDTKTADLVYTRLIAEQGKVLSQTLAALILAQYPLSETARKNAAAAFSAFVREGVNPRDTVALQRMFNDRVFGPMAQEYRKATGKTLDTFEIESIRYDETTRQYLFTLNQDGSRVAFNEGGEIAEGNPPAQPLMSLDETESVITRWFGPDALNDARSVFRRIRNEVSAAAFSPASFLKLDKSLDGALSRREGEDRLIRRVFREGLFFQADVDKLRELNKYLGNKNVDFLIACYLDVMHREAARYGGFAARWGGDEGMGFIPGNLSKRRALAILDAMREQVIDTFNGRYGVAVLPDGITKEQFVALQYCDSVISFDQDRGFVLFRTAGLDPDDALARIRRESGIPGLRLHDFNGGSLFYPTVSVGAVDIRKVPEAKDATLKQERFVQILTDYAGRAVHKAKENGRNRVVCEVVRSSGHETGQSTLADTPEPDVAEALRATSLSDVPNEQLVRKAAADLLNAGKQVTIMRLLPSYKGNGLLNISSSKGNGWLRFKAINDGDTFAYRGGDDTIRLNYVCALLDLEKELQKLVGEVHIARSSPDNLVIVFKGTLDNAVLTTLVDRLTAKINANSRITVSFDVVAVRSEKKDLFAGSGSIFRRADQVSQAVQPPSDTISPVITPEHSRIPGMETRFFSYDPAQRDALNQTMKAIIALEGAEAERNLGAMRSKRYHTTRNRARPGVIKAETKTGSGGHFAPASLEEQLRWEQVHVITDDIASRILTDGEGNRYVEPGILLKVNEHYYGYLRFIRENGENFAYVSEFARALAAILHDLDGAVENENSEILRAFCLQLLTALMRESFTAKAHDPEAIDRLAGLFAGVIAGIKDKEYIAGLANDVVTAVRRAISSVQAEDLDAMESGADTPVYLAIIRMMERTGQKQFFTAVGRGLASMKQSVEKEEIRGSRDVQLDVIDFLLAESTALFGGMYWMRRTARRGFNAVLSLNPAALASGKRIADGAEVAVQERTWISENVPGINGVPFLAVRECLTDQDLDDLSFAGEMGVSCPIAFTGAVDGEALDPESFLFSLEIPAEQGGQDALIVGAYAEKVVRNGVTVNVIKLDYRQGNGERTYVLGRGAGAFLKQLFENPRAMEVLGLKDRGIRAIIDTGDDPRVARYADPRSFDDQLGWSLSGGAVVIISAAQSGEGQAAARRNADIVVTGIESAEQVLAECGRKMINKVAESAAMRGGSNLNIRFDVPQLRNRPDREETDRGTGKLISVRPFFDALKGIRGGNVYVQMGKVYDPADPRVVNEAIVVHAEKADKGDRSARMQKYAGIVDPKRYAALEGFEQFEDAVNYIHQNGGKVALDCAIPAGADLELYRAAIAGWVRTFGIDTVVLDLSGRTERTDILVVEKWYLALCEEVRLGRPETELPLLLAPQFAATAGRLSEQTGQKQVMIWEGDSESVPVHMTGEKVFLKVMPRQDSEAVWENISGAVSKAPVADVSIPVPGEVFSGDRFKPEGENPFTLAQVSEYVHRMVARVIEPYAKGYATAMQYDKKHLPRIDGETDALFETKEITASDGAKISASMLYAPLALYKHAQASGNEEIVKNGQCLSLALAAAKLLPGTAGLIVEDKVTSLQQAAEGSSAETVAALTRELAGYWEGILGRALTEQYVAAHGALPFSNPAQREAFSRLLVAAAGSINSNAFEGAESGMTVETLNVMAALGFRTAAARLAKRGAPRMNARMQETAKAGNLTIPFMATMLNFVNLSYNYMNGRSEGVLAGTANDILAMSAFHIGSLTTDQDGVMQAAYLEALQNYPVKGGNRSEFLNRSKDVAQSLISRYPSARIREELKKTVPQAGDQGSLERYLAQVNLLITVMKAEGNTVPDIRAAIEPFLPPLTEAMEKGSLSQPGAIAEAFRILDILNDQEKNLTADRIERTVIKNLDKTIRGTARIRSAA